MHHWSLLNAWSLGLLGYGNYIRLIVPDVPMLRPFLKNQSTESESGLSLYNSHEYLNSIPELTSNISKVYKKLRDTLVLNP